MPRISIIVPVHNAEKFVDQCIKSILAQTFQNFELILVDDGSPDNCGAICEEYAAKDDRIKVIHKENGGVSSARNVGLGIAKGEYIAFIDSDDWIHHSFLQEAVRICERDGYDIFLGGFVRVFPDKSEQCSHIPDVISNTEAMVTEKQWAELLKSGYIASSCSKVMRRTLIGDTHFDNSMKFGEDLKFVLDLMQKNPLFYATPEIYYYYRATENSLTQVFDRSKLYNVLSTYRLLISFSEKNKFESTFWNLIQERWRNDLLYLQRMIMHSNHTRIQKFALLKILHKDPQLNAFLRDCDDKYVKRYASNPLLVLLYQDYRSFMKCLRRERK